jgi:hypothetical protein
MLISGVNDTGYKLFRDTTNKFVGGVVDTGD